MTPEQYCQTKAVQSGSSFYYSFLFLPERQRQAITALYAFCREVDDIVDECHDNKVASIKLDWWRQEINRCFNGSGRHPVCKALQGPIQEFNLQCEYFLEIIEGMQMDLDQNRYESFNDLSVYCQKVAGMVGKLSIQIFGYKNNHTIEYATNLGTAFQLTNIIRDVFEDAQRGRIYLPLDELPKFKVNPHDLLQGRNTKEMKYLFAFQTQRAREYYQKAFSALPEEDRLSQRSSVIMAEIYQTLLNEIECDGFALLQQQTKLTPIRKLWIAWKTSRREKRRRYVNP